MMKLFGKILLTVLVSLVLAEGLLRVSMTFSWESPLYVVDPDVGYRMRPKSVFGEVTVNDHGFNDRDHQRDKSPNTFRVAFIGDSFVFGVVPRPQNFVSLIQRLASHSGKKWEMLNMGIPAAGPRNYLGLLRRDAVQMQADAVGVVFFMGNDLTQSHPDFETRLWFGAPYEMLAQPGLIGLSTKYICLHRAYQASARILRERFRRDRNGTFSKQSFLEIERQRMVNFETIPSFYMKRSYPETIAILKQMAGVAKKNGMAFFVVLAPAEIQVNSDLQQEVIRAYYLKPESYDFSRPQQLMVRDLETAGIPVLDLLPAFQAETANDLLYVKQDTHWNEAGNRLAAQAIWTFMKDRQLMRGLADQ